VVDVVVNGTPTVEAAATGSLYVVSAPIAAGETVQIDDVILTVTAGPPSLPDEFDGSPSDAATVAANLAAAINNGSLAGWDIVTASAENTLVTLTAVAAGEAGNEIALEVSTTQMAVGSATLTGGSEQTILTIGGQSLYAVDGERSSGGMDFDINDAGASITEAIADPLNTLPFVTASWGGTCITISAATAGLAGNGITVVSNSDTLFPAYVSTQGGTGTPCPPGKDNSRWNVLGVNIYRSDTGDRGPYFRVNRIPLGTLFFRDKTDVVEVPAEIVAWNGGWVFKGDSPNNKGWRIKTRFPNLVKWEGNAIPADSPFDVEVYIDGERAIVTRVFGPTGEIDISTEQVWDPSIENYQYPPIPTETSTVTVRYYYRKSARLVNTLDERYKVFYRIATVALDTTGTSPSGLVETPLEYCPPVSPMDSEQLDYMWKEAIRRNRWILEQGGERVKLFIRRVTGNKCECVWDPRLEAYLKQPMNNCLMCYGTGWIGGYEGPYDIIVGPDDTDRRVTQTATGRRLEHTYEVWIGPSPMLSQRDFIVKQNGERYSVGPVRRTQVRGRVLQQTFQIGYLDSTDIRYSVPMAALERLPWPETRYSNPEDSPCADEAPYPVGADYQASPMMTEKGSIPDAREQRGRTPVYQTIMYGGKGGR